MSAMHDDLNTPRALSVIWKTVDSEYPTDAKAETILKMDKVLGLGISEFVGKPVTVPSDIAALLSKRKEARHNKDWAESDRIRDEIQARGWSIEDSAGGQNVFPA
jgi:cysteinyl-tRNA synthetase